MPLSSVFRRSVALVWRWLGPLAVILPLCAARDSPPDLASFWPLGAPARHWALVDDANSAQPHAPVTMSVRTQPLGPAAVILWFSGKPGQAPGAEDGERYHVCEGPTESWLYLDAYIDRRPGKPPASHPVHADRILYTPAGAPPADLIATGAYAACGAAGQPYLLWRHLPASYRIQVWGHLDQNRSRLWYWDATVTAPRSIADACLRHPIRAVQVQEAWWSNFARPSGAWGLGAGDLAPDGHGPTGRLVRYGRTVWHGAGQTPYAMTGNPRGQPTWCTRP